jgi:hypothetical protein
MRACERVIREAADSAPLVSNPFMGQTAARGGDSPEMDDRTMKRTPRVLRTVTVAALLLASSTAYAQSISSEEQASRVTRAWALLRRTLETGTFIDQANVVFAIAAIESAAAMSWLEQVARSKSSMRPVAVGQLAKSGRPEFVPLVREALADPDPYVRREAVQYIGRSPDAEGLLRDLLISGDPELAGYAANRARWQEGAAAASLLLDMIAEGHAAARAAAAMELYSALQSGRDSAQVLDELRRRQPEKVLTNTLRDSDPVVRAWGALLLARLGNAAGTRELTSIVMNQDRNFTYRAVAALNFLGVPGYRERLVAALMAADRDTRMGAINGLEAFPAAASSVVFQQVLAGPVTPDVRYAAFRHVAKATTTVDAARLHPALADSDRSMRLLAAQRLLELGPDARSVDVLETMILDSVEQGESPRMMLGLFAEHAEPARARALLRSLLPKSASEMSSNQQDVHFFADVMGVIVYLERLGDREAVPAIAALFGAEQNVNQRVVHALVALARRDAGDTLTAAMDTAPHLNARIHAAAGVIRLYGVQSPN